MARASEAVTERRVELVALGRLLDARLPALATLTGSRGSGKSFVTKAFLDTARQSGWRATPYRDGRGVRTGSGTTEADFSREVALALELNPPAAGRHPLRRLTTSLQQQARLTPLVMVLDPFAPDPELLEALNRDLFATLRAGTEPVIALVVSRSKPKLEPEPDLELRISAPGEDALRARLAELTTVSGHGIDDAELDHYVVAARSSTRILASLVAVLPIGVEPSGTRGFR